MSEFNKDNKGFTLMELLLGLAIGSMVMIAAFGFMMIGSKNYEETSKNTDMQTEMQFTNNLVGDSIIEGSAAGTEYTVSSAGSVKQLNTGKHVLYYNKNLQKLAIYNTVAEVGNDIDQHLISDKVVEFNIEFVESKTEDQGGSLVDKDVSADGTYKPDTTNLVKVTTKFKIKNNTKTSIKYYQIRNK